MNQNTRYYISQIVAVPTVMLPTVVAALFVGGAIARFTGSTGFVEQGVIIVSIGWILSRGLSVVTGLVLEKVGLLPKFSWRYYPNETSWGGYLKRGLRCGGGC